MAGPWYDSYRNVDRFRLKRVKGDAAAELFVRAEAMPDDANDNISIRLDEEALEGLRFVASIDEDADDSIWERDDQ